MSFAELASALQTSIDPKDAGNSAGLTSEEAKARLQRDGRNVLTPPIKKSALRKASIVVLLFLRCAIILFYSILIALGQCLIFSS